MLDFASVLGLPKEEAAAKLYPDITIDTALPQGWVDAHAAEGFDVQPHFVWGYPDFLIYGEALPITEAGYVWQRGKDEL